MTPQDLWGCPVVSVIGMIHADPLDAVGCGVGCPWIRLVCPAHFMEARSDWDLDNLEAGLATLDSLPACPYVWWAVVQGIPAPFYHSQHLFW